MTLVLVLAIALYLLALEDLKAVLRHRGRDARWRAWVLSDLIAPEDAHAPDGGFLVTRGAYEYAQKVNRDRLRPGSFDVIYGFFLDRLDVYELDAELDRLNGLREDPV